VRDRGGGEEWGDLASGRLIFRAINAPVLALSLSLSLSLSKRAGSGDDTSDLLQVPDDGYEIDLCGQRWGHLFHSRDPAHCLHVPACPDDDPGNSPFLPPPSTSISQEDRRVRARDRTLFGFPLGGDSRINIARGDGVDGSAEP